MSLIDIQESNKATTTYAFIRRQNVILFQIARVCMRQCCSNGAKLFDRTENIVWKEEFLVTSIFSFSHNIFKWILSQGGKTSALRGTQVNVCYELVHVKN